MAKYDFGGGCACGVQKHCDCDQASAEDLRNNIPSPQLSPDGKTLRCPQCTRTWSPGEDPGCDRCKKLWDRIDALEGKHTFIRTEILPPTSLPDGVIGSTYNAEVDLSNIGVTPRPEHLPEDELDIDDELGIKPLID